MLELIIGIIKLQWLLISLLVIFGVVIGFLFKPATEKATRRLNDFNLVVVSIANNGVKNALLDNLEYHYKKFKEYKRYLVIDEGAELQTELQSLQNRYNYKLVIVPKNFKIKAIAKGRAIEYFNRIYVKDESWYGFIDDDNKILDDAFLYEIPKYDKLGYSFANPILKPRKGDSWITYNADWIRYLDDRTLFSACTHMLKRPLIGIHGELLIVKGIALQDVTFNRKTITEDFAFAWELYWKNYKCWQSETIVSILSPHTMKDFLKQRNRWYKGLVKDVLSAKAPMLLITGTKLFTWSIGILSSWTFFILWFFIDMSWPLRIITLLGMSYFIWAYAYGIFHTKGWHRKVGVILLIPVYSVLENLAPYYSLFKKGKDKFEVIKK